MASSSLRGSVSAVWSTLLTTGGLLLLLSSTAYSAYELRIYEKRVAELERRVEIQALERDDTTAMMTATPIADDSALSKKVEQLEADLAAARQDGSKCEDELGKMRNDLNSANAAHDAEMSKTQATLNQLRDENKSLKERPCLIVN